LVVLPSNFKIVIVELVSLKDFAKSKNIASVSSVFLSKDNKYPMILMINDNGDKIPLMLSRSASKVWPERTSPVDFAKVASVVTYEDENLGTVSRLSSGSQSVSTADLF
jgi:hypothetical protein